MLNIIWVKFTVEDKVFPKITKLLLSGTDVLLNMKLELTDIFGDGGIRRRFDCSGLAVRCRH